VRKVKIFFQVFATALCLAVFMSSPTNAQTYDCGTYSAGDYGEGCTDESTPAVQQTGLPTGQGVETDPAPIPTSDTTNGDEADDIRTQTEDSNPASDSSLCWWILVLAGLLILMGLAAFIYYRRRHNQGV
jgi:LPXTG-motif cell wall-anchored protein